MSGVEALAVVGINANFYALTELCAKVVSQVKAYGEKANEVPKAFQDVTVLLPLTGRTLLQVQKQVEQGAIVEESYNDLHPLLEKFRQKLASLQAILDQCLLRERSSRFTPLAKTIDSISKEKEFGDIVRTLDSNTTHLNLFLTSRPVELSDHRVLVTKLASMQVSVNAPAPEPKMHSFAPMPDVDDFVSREQSIRALDAKLFRNNRSSRVVLEGLGGIGKSRIVLQYISRFKSSTELSVYWIYAGTIERVKSALYEIAHKVHLPGSMDPAIDILQLTSNWFSSKESGKWLLVIDNADDIGLFYNDSTGVLDDWLPRSEQGAILLTTRNHRVASHFTSAQNLIKISAMSPHESKTLLQNRLGGLCSEHRSVVALAEELQHIPLALVQAASFMFENATSVQRYLQIYRESDTRKIELLSEDFKDETRDTLSKNPVTTTWFISFEYLHTHAVHAQAEELLSFMSMLAPSWIPENILPQAESPIEFEKCLGTLRAFSFISETESSQDSTPSRQFSLHRLVRLVMRKWISANGLSEKWLAISVRNLARQSGKIGSKDVVTSSPWVMPHVLEVLNHDILRTDLVLATDDVPVITHIPISDHEYRVPKAFQSFKDRPQCCGDGLAICPAQYYTSRYVAIVAYVYGADTEYTLATLCKNTYHLLASEDQNEEILRKLWPLVEATYGRSHLYTLHTLTALGRSLFRNGKTEEAEEIGVTLVNIFTVRENKRIKAGLKRGVLPYTLYAEACTFKGSLDEAIKYQRIAVEVCFETYGYDSVESVAIWVTLSSLLADQKRWEEACQAGLKAQVLWTNISGEAHPASLAWSCFLVVMLRGLERMPEAIALARNIVELSSQLTTSDDKQSLQQQLLSFLEKASPNNQICEGRRDH